MDNDILKMIPQKAFKLLSIKESLKVTSMVTSSMINTKAYEELFQKRLLIFKFPEIKMSQQNDQNEKIILDKLNGEKILRIYFSQFYSDDLAVHLDYRNAFTQNNKILNWKPSKLHYKFSKNFLDGVKTLYQGFYLDDKNTFLNGLKLMGIINEKMDETKKNEVVELFLLHFGDGKERPIKFSLTKLQSSFNEIFSSFIKNDIPLNPEFAVLGIALVTLYKTLEQIPEELDVKKAFLEVYNSV
jgi:hypothetical protein